MKPKFLDTIWFDQYTSINLKFRCINIKIVLNAYYSFVLNYSCIAKTNNIFLHKKQDNLALCISLDHHIVYFKLQSCQLFHLLSLIQ